MTPELFTPFIEVLSLRTLQVRSESCAASLQEHCDVMAEWLVAGSDVNLWERDPRFA